MTKKKLFKIIHNYFSNTDVDAIKWQEILENCSSYPSKYHLLNTIKYGN